MAFVGLVPSERTTGDTVRRAPLLTDFPRVGETLRGRLKELPLSIRSIAWKAQVRLCALPSAHCQWQEDL
jgi:transposase